MGWQSVKHAMKHVSRCLEELLTHFNGGNWALFVWGSAESLCYEVMFMRGGGKGKKTFLSDSAVLEERAAELGSF